MKSENMVPLLFVSLFTLGLSQLIPIALGASISPTLSIRTDKASYVGNEFIVVRGTFQPNMGPAVVVSIRSPSGAYAFLQTAYMEDDNSEYTASFAAGGPEWAESGVYLVTARWDTLLGSVSNQTSFTYTALRVAPNQILSTQQSSTSSSSASTQTSSPSPQPLSSFVILTAVPIAVVGLIVGALVVIRRSNRLRGRQLSLHPSR